MVAKPRGGEEKTRHKKNMVRDKRIIVDSIKDHGSHLFKIVRTTLNGLPRSWESFIQGICSKIKLPKFSRLWEECTQEEARLALARE